MSELSRQFYFSHFIGYICRNAQTVTHINQSHKQSPISHTSNQSHMKSLTRKRVIRIQLQTQSPHGPHLSNIWPQTRAPGTSVVQQRNESPSSHFRRPTPTPLPRHKSLRDTTADRTANAPRQTTRCDCLHRYNTVSYSHCSVQRIFLSTTIVLQAWVSSVVSSVICRLSSVVSPILKMGFFPNALSQRVEILYASFL